jgi:hypothetical protein
MHQYDCCACDVWLAQLTRNQNRPAQLWFWPCSNFFQEGATACSVFRDHTLPQLVREWFGLIQINFVAGLRHWQLKFMPCAELVHQFWVLCSFPCWKPNTVLPFTDTKFCTQPVLIKQQCMSSLWQSLMLCVPCNCRSNLVCHMLCLPIRKLLEWNRCSVRTIGWWECDTLFDSKQCLWYNNDKSIDTKYMLFSVLSSNSVCNIGSELCYFWTLSVMR